MFNIQVSINIYDPKWYGAYRGLMKFSVGGKNSLSLPYGITLFWERGVTREVINELHLGS